MEAGVSVAGIVFFKSLFACISPMRARMLTMMGFGGGGLVVVKRTGRRMVVVMMLMTMTAMLWLLIIVR